MIRIEIPYRDVERLLGRTDRQDRGFEEALLSLMTEFGFPTVGQDRNNRERVQILMFDSERPGRQSTWHSSIATTFRLPDDPMNGPPFISQPLSRPIPAPAPPAPDPDTFPLIRRTRFTREE